MSNRYYSFLSNRLIQWLKQKKDLKPGDKYFVLQDNSNDTKELFTALQENKFEERTLFYSREFDYKTTGAKINGVRILFVAPVNGITQDFLVTVRNRVNANIGEWENTAVFFVVHDALDSIVGGAFDTSQKEAPFDIRTIKAEVKGEIDAQKNLTEGKRKALELYLDKVTDNSSSILRDYETVFSIIDKGEIDSEDFNAMGYFPDNSLDSIPKQNLEKRLLENTDIFEKIEAMHGMLDIESRLGEFIAKDSLIKELAKSEVWKEVQFTPISQAMEEFKSAQEVTLNFDTQKMINNESENWFRLESERGLKSRKAYAVYQGKTSDEGIFSFEICFDDMVQKSSIVLANTFLYEGFGNPEKEMEIISKGKRLVITIHNYNPDITYGGMIRYKHKNITKLTFDFKFMIVPFSLLEINTIRPNFKIEIIKKSKQFYFGISENVPSYSFGVDSKKEKMITSLAEIENHNLIGETINLEDTVYKDEENGKLMVNIKIYQYDFPIMFNDLIERPIPSRPLSIEKQRLANSLSQFQFKDNKIFTGSNIISLETNYKTRLIIENAIISQNSLYGKLVNDNEYYSIELDIPIEIREKYDKLFEYYRVQETVLSIAINDENHIELLNDILQSIQDILSKRLLENEKIEKQIANISKIGVVIEGESFSLNPLNPLMIAYNLELYKNLETTKKIPKENILSTLNAQYLIPYIQFEQEQYQSFYTKQIPRWLFFNKFQERKLSEISSSVITKRIDDYVTQYRFLFETNTQASVNIAAIKIIDEENFFDAIVNFVFNRIEELEHIDLLNPINLYFDNLGHHINSLFKELYEIRQMDKLNTLLKKPFKTSKFEDFEVLEALQRKINVYKIPDNTKFNELGLFFHITFYQFIQAKEVNLSKIDKLNKSYSLNGLINGPQYFKEKENYTNGFGIGQYQEVSRSKLIDFSILWNSFLATASKSTNIYMSGYTLANNIPQLEADEITPILKNSSWVTLLDLDVDLSYFFDNSNGEMLVIHYTDQSTTSQYESVTVTKDIQQYGRLLKEKIIEEVSDREIFNTKEVIKNFNVINGQWLLKIISDKSKNKGNKHFLREKVSIISAYKELLGILEHQDIYWVPVSMEEILRISGMVGLSQKEGIFSSKNLGHSGATSDDLLMIGIDMRKSQLALHYLPVEVKIGNNNDAVTRKAIEQVEHTATILEQFLGEENQEVFMREYYKNFFVSILLSNLDKIISSNLIQYPNIEQNIQLLKDQLVIGEYTISNELKDIYGMGVVFEFTKDRSNRTVQFLHESKVCLIQVPEQDAYNILVDSVDNVIETIQRGEFAFTDHMLLRNKLDHDVNLDDTRSEELITEIVDMKPSSSLSKSQVELDIITNEETMDTHIHLSNPTVEANIVTKYDDDDHHLVVSEEMNQKIVNETVQVQESKLERDSIQDVRLYIGQNKNLEKIYWEYGNKKLANRHLFVTGKSGQGKTYFVQRVLSQMSEQNISTLVIDYTDGFLPNQLDTKFLEQYTSKIDQRFIFTNKLPINPFKLYEIDLGGISVPETEQDMVDRVVQIIDFVFNLGIQQRTLLSEAILIGFREHREAYTFELLSTQLRYSEDKGLQNLYGRISTLLTRDPFSYEKDFEWNQVFDGAGKVNIFQMKGFQLNIQKVLIEFLLWDVYQYATRVGKESMPLPIILDEVQNLDFSKNSPAVKLLREGRKFGLSGIFATQSLDSIKGDDSEAIYNAAEQIHFLPPESQVSSIANSITSNSSDKGKVESYLKNLHKGEALVYGPVSEDNQELSESRINTVDISSF